MARRGIPGNCLEARTLSVVGAAILLLVSGTASGHVLQAPAVVEAEPGGSFDFEALFRVGPGNESISMYSVYGSDNLDGVDYDADGECIFLLEEGEEVSIAISGSLVDSNESGTVSVHFVTCGLSGEQTVFDAEITIVPSRGHSVYWVESGAIRRRGIEGGDVETVVDPEDGDAAGRIALDPVGGRIYWSAWEPFVGSVRRADLFGEGIEEFPGGGGKGSPGGIAVDLPSRDLYVSDPSDCIPLCGSISRIALDATSSQHLIFLNAPNALAIDSGLDTMCWSDDWDQWVQCSDLNADDVRTVVDDTWAGGVALDPVTAKVFWTDKTNQTIRRGDTDGSNIQDLVTTGLESPADIALDPVGRKIYWTDTGTDKIQRANLDGSDVEDVVTGLSDPTGIALMVGEGSIELELEHHLVQWSAAPGATSYDIVSGDLSTLRATGGDFASATDSCVADTVAGTVVEHHDEPGQGEGLWFLVRAVTVTGNGTYDVGAASQVEGRDAEIVASGFDCN